VLGVRVLGVGVGFVFAEIVGGGRGGAVGIDRAEGTGAAGGGLGGA
jgi:hypothetical protein